MVEEDEPHLHTRSSVLDLRLPCPEFVKILLSLPSK